MNDTTLRRLPGRGWVKNRIEDCFSYALSPLDHRTRRKLSISVFNEPDDLPESCHGNCPVDATGSHAVAVMSPLLAGGYFGPESGVPVVDGLTTRTIVSMKGHAALVAYRSLLDLYQFDEIRNGDPESIGAIMVTVPLKDGGEFNFVVAVSGADKRLDHFIAETVASRIVLQLLLDDLIPLRRLEEGAPFVKGVSRAEADAHADQEASASEATTP
jgi:hypothetical protein